MNYYKKFLGDFQKKTRHLSLLENGAYNVLLDAFYSTEKPLPAHRPTLYRMVGAIMPDEQEAVRKILSEYWDMEKDGYVNARAVEELEKFRERSETNRRVALEREEAKRTNRATDCDTNRAENVARSHSHSHKPDTNSHHHPLITGGGGGEFSILEWGDIVDQWEPEKTRDPERLALVPEFRKWAKTSMRARTGKALNNAWGRFIANHT